MRRISVLLAAVLTSAGCASTPADTGGGSLAAPPDRPVSIGDAQGGCVEEYGADTLRNRAFAFDGTVVSIDHESTDEAGYVDVEFEVDEWFAGGEEQTVTVQMMPPETVSSVDTVSYDVGTRLLVAGEPRWGGEPLDDPVAWGCGFTQPYSATTAAEWRDAFAGEN